MRRADATRGFTLLEVLIALAVVALALTALVRAAGVSGSDFAGMRERTLASWIAANVVAETRLAQRSPAPGRREGRVQYAGRDWRWELDVQDTPEAGIRRLDVRVYAGEERAAASASLTGFSGDILAP
ncbi:MAG TPA: type II secretion system minor pseudopilin GspI [Rhodanobacteraceae bacterium]|nr:type II secretion system minor pseudopilin GspI [Rhodanobacteraceae bacterium]